MDIENIYEYNRNFGQGVEEEVNEEVNESVDISDVGVISEAIIVASDWTVGTLYQQISKNNIDLNPHFQRRDVWNDTKKSRLIESILLNIPIPQLLLAERKGEKNKYLVLDGKQRLLAIQQFLHAYHNDSEEFKLKNLTVFTTLNNKTPKEAFEIIPELHELEGYDFESFENNTIRTVFIRNWPTNEYLYQVFNRLNTGAVQLSPQELRMSLYPGPFSDYILDVSGNPEVLQILNLSEPDKRMRDVELVLRFFAFHYCLGDYKGKLKIFLDKTTEALNDKWASSESEIKESFDELICAILFSKKVLPEKYLFKNPDSRSASKKIVLPVFESLIYYFANPEIRANFGKLEGNKAECERFYTALFADGEYIDAIESHTSDQPKVKYRFNFIAKKLNQLFDENEVPYKIKLPFEE